MNELIKIEETGGVTTVNARELHEFLESKQEFAHWIKNRIEKYGFLENDDFMIILSKSSGGRPAKEYHLSLDMAKEISMVENNDKGREARKYFITVEKRAKDFTANMNDPIITMRLKQMEIEQRMSSIEEDINILRPDPFFYTVTAYAKGKRRRVDNLMAQQIGKDASQRCKSLGITPGKVPDSKWNYVRTYPEDILDDVTGWDQ